MSKRAVAFVCLALVALCSFAHAAAPTSLEIIQQALAENQNTQPRVLPAGVDAPLANTFTAVKPGGTTTCASGDPFLFFWRQGSNGNLTVFFQGGGACWDAGSCLMPIYKKTVDEFADNPENAGGFFAADSRSPVAEDTMLYIPYCTADVHIGNNTANYGLYSIHHRGRVNVEAALDFIQLQMPRPAHVTVAGCSAGSLGAFLNAPYVFNRFPDAQYKVWGDSEIGIVASQQWPAAYKNWNMLLPPWIPALAPQFTAPWTPTVAGYILAAAANYYPQSVWAAYTSNADIVQASFYDMGGGKDNWTTLMRNQFDFIRSNATNVATYIASGAAHCVDASAAYWTVESGGVMLWQWVQEFIEEAPTFNHTVDCTPNC